MPQNGLAQTVHSAIAHAVAKPTVKYRRHKGLKKGKSWSRIIFQISLCRLIKWFYSQRLGHFLGYTQR